MQHPPLAEAPPPFTMFCLHFLGGSAREWRPLADRLADTVACVAIDLPGFGDAADVPGYSVAEMVEHVARVVRAHAPVRWVLAGHSMGAKVALVLARQAQDEPPDGAAGLGGLAGLVLLAGSPPAPEPMQESRRQDMLGWLTGDAATRAAEAQRFIAANVTTLPPEARAGAEQDVLRAHPAAWQAWLRGGSREDWSDRVGRLSLPALVLAGAEDGDLGPEAQARLTAPHLAGPLLLSVPAAKHLLPLEAPEFLAHHIRHFLRDLPPPLPPAYRALLESDRTSAPLRDGLLARTLPHAPATPSRALPAAAFAVLHAVLARVVPQPPGARIDLAASIDRALAEDAGDGWRFAALPPDREAFIQALRGLDELSAAAHAGGFAGLSDDAQDAMLRRVEAGEAGVAGLLDAAQAQLWFQDLRAMAARHYVAHPATLARMGYSGVASGGDGPRKSGFVRVGISEREAWEPVAAAGALS